MKALHRAMEQNEQPKPYDQKVPAGTPRRIACDSSLIKLTEDQNSEPLSVGRKTRTIPLAINRALRARDKRCRFPGCTNTRFIDGHHLQCWANGSETSLEKLVDPPHESGKSLPTWRNISRSARRSSMARP